jgi:putative hydrolase of the HAD superfamily
MYSDIKVIAFDADDTLWVNEPYFREAEDKFCEMMEEFLPSHDVARSLLRTEIENIPTFGYGVKSFIISMIETAISISNGSISSENINRIIAIGRAQLMKPIEILDGVEDVLSNLLGKYRLVMATKGDLLEQQKKLTKSGLEKYFHHIEIVSEKKEEDYAKLIKHLDIDPGHFLMIGNSLKSDILPVLNIGGHGIHIPFHTTWEFEKVDSKIDHEKFRKVAKVREILNYV